LIPDIESSEISCQTITDRESSKVDTSELSIKCVREWKPQIFDEPIKILDDVIKNDDSKTLDEVHKKLKIHEHNVKSSAKNLREKPKITEEAKFSEKINDKLRIDDSKLEAPRRNLRGESKIAEEPKVQTQDRRSVSKQKKQMKTLKDLPPLEPSGNQDLEQNSFNKEISQRKEQKISNFYESAEYDL
jgi:hypothetical protein